MLLAILVSVAAALAVVVCVYPAVPIELFRRFGRRWAGLSRKTIEVEGFRWVYLDNEANAPVLILLHGVPTSIYAEGLALPLEFLFTNNIMTGKEKGY